MMMMMMIRLRPNGSHKFAADSAMTKDAEVKPAEFETCSDRMVVEDEARCLRKAMKQWREGRRTFLNFHPMLLRT
jgi:hypothetical protein